MWINKIIIRMEDGSELIIDGPVVEIDENDPGSALADIRNTLMAAFEEITGREVDVIFPEVE